MEIVLLIARLLLALVFGVAGIAKAADPNGSRRAMIGFGVTEKLASPLAWLLCAAEVLIAIALIPLNSAWLGGIAAFILLLVFALTITVNLARGNSPDCHCFGQLHSEPVGWSTLARNLALMAVAGLIIIKGIDNPGLSAVSWLSELKPLEVVNLIFSFVVVALLATCVVYLRRVLSQQSTTQSRIDAMKKVIDEDYAEPPVERPDAAGPIEGLPVGALAPDFSLAAIGGGQITLENLLAHRRPVLLLFVSPYCSPCEQVLPAVSTWERDYDSQFGIAVISKGSLEDNQSRVAQHGARHLLLQGASTVSEDYRAKWTPAAVIVSRYGRIASQMAFGDEAIRALVNSTVTRVEKKSAASAANGNGHEPRTEAGDSLFEVGDTAPRFSLPDMEGHLVSTESLMGRDTLLVFWDPGCRFCQAMSADIRSWESSLPKRAPRLVFVAVGDTERIEVESRSFKSLFLHDREYKISKLFGTSLTPAAVLIDRDGRIASPVAAGVPNVLALVGTRKGLPIAPTF